MKLEQRALEANQCAGAERRQLEPGSAAGPEAKRRQALDRCTVIQLARGQPSGGDHEHSMPVGDEARAVWLAAMAARRRPGGYSWTTTAICTAHISTRCASTLAAMEDRLVQFRRRLAEAIRWPTDAQPRPAALRPPETLNWPARTDWVCARRAEMLGSAPAVDAAAGRLLVFDPGESLTDGAAQVESEGWFDEDNAPPWETWIAYIIEEPRHAGRWTHLDSYLLCWVPGDRVDVVDRSILVIPERCVEWASAVDTPFLRRLKSEPCPPTDGPDSPPRGKTLDPGRRPDGSVYLHLQVRHRIGQRLLEEALSTGVAVEQIGHADGVRLVEDDEGELIGLRFGAEGEERFDDLEEAVARIRQYAEEYGADGSRPAAIIRFVKRLAQLVAHLPESERLSALVERLDDEVEAIANRLGLEECAIAADDVEIGFFEDENGVLWRVYFEDGLTYALFEDDD